MVAPKTLLRDPRATSSMDDMAPGSHFLPVIGDAAADEDPDAVRRVVFCAGKMFYDLQKARDEAEPKGVKTALVRLEELAPFPAAMVEEQLAKFPKANKLFWAQEEPANAGAWQWVDAHASQLDVEGRRSVALQYVGRPALATPAVGLGKRSAAQARHIIQCLFPSKK